MARKPVAEDSRLRPEPVRALPVPGSWAYVENLSVKPGSAVSAHASVPSSHEIEFVQLGTSAVLDPEQSLEADCDEARVLERRSCGPTPRTIDPGSYFYVAGDPLSAGPLSMGLWVRLWQLAAIDVVQIAWMGLITDIDYPDAARFGLLVDHLGRICVYAGDGGAFRHRWLHTSPPLLSDAVGHWAHVAASIEDRTVHMFLNGRRVAEIATEIPKAAAGPAARLRIGGLAEGGKADGFLDGDIAAPFLGSFVLGEKDAQRLFEDGTRRMPAELGLGPLAGYWPLDEERGTAARDASGNGRHATIVNHGTWMVGGPRFNAASRQPGTYDPDNDPDRGHGLRLCSDDLMDAGWPVSARFDVPGDAPSGIYAVRVRLAGQMEEACTVPFVVSRRHPRKEKSLVLLTATNTWHAYGRRPTKELAIAGLTSSFYSTHGCGRPFFHLGLRLPIPRAHPYGFESKRAARTGSTHLVRAERFMEAWLRREGYPFEMITDLDLHEEPQLLERFDALVIAGHSEYWTDEARKGVIDYLGRGGRVLSLSGDTMTVRVTFDRTQQVLECRKKVPDSDRRWLGPAFWGESWHSDDGKAGGDFAELGKPAWAVLGTGFKGMIDDGVSNAYAGYKVLRPEHFLMRTPHAVTPDLHGMIGVKSLNGSGGASGYEFDANVDRIGAGGGPLPGITTLASAAGQRNIEWVGEPDHGADLIYWERPEGGTIVSFGSIAAGGALPVDPAFANLVHNTLAHFGIPRGTANSP